VTENVCIGVDIGGTNLRGALVNRLGEILCRQALATDIARGSSAFISRLLQMLERLRSGAAKEGMRAVAVGLGVPGLVASDGALGSSVNLLPLEGVNLARTVGLATGLPAVALNDANAAAVGEYRFGAAKAYRSSLTVTLGTGVGSGLILDGRLWTGADGAAGEFGHITVEPEGRSCGCGNRGCLEQYASATAIAAALPGEARGAAGVACRAVKGDPQAVEVFEQAGRYLGIAAAGVVNLLNLEAIVLGGGVAASFELLAAPMHRELLARSFEIPGTRVKLLKAALGDDAGVLGAAAAAFESFPAG